MGTSAKGGAMTKPVSAFVCLLAVSLLWPGKALPQTASPEALAAAKEFMIASKMADQINNILPHAMQQFKPIIARGNPLVERDFDALLPVVMKAMNSRMDEFLGGAAYIYARYFTADEIRQLTIFYRTPVMEKFLQKQPEILQATAALGNKFGEVLVKDLQTKMIEELRKRGHDI